MQTAFGVPCDPFQGARSLGRPPVEDLAHRWATLVRELDDEEFCLADEWDEEERRDKVWSELNKIEPQIIAASNASAASIALKLRMAAWHRNIDNAFCENYDGVRTNALSYDEEIIASALADADRLAKA